MGIAVETVKGLRDPAEWFELGRVTELLANGSMSGTDWAQLAVAVAIWVGVPMLLGVLRLRRHELK